MALRFHLAAKIGGGHDGFSGGGGELKLKRSRIGGLLSAVNLTIFRRPANNSVRRLVLCHCSSSSPHHEDNSSPTGNSFCPKSFYDFLLEDMRERGEGTLWNIRVGGGHWEYSVAIPEVVEAADLAVKLYNNQQNAKLELVGLVKAYGTVNAGWYFEIILEAVDHDTGETNKYESYVWLNAVKKSGSKLFYLRLASHKS